MPPRDTDPSVSALLRAHSGGDGGALEQLLPIVYDELRSLASAVFSSQRPGHTLQPTVLAHEAWLKLAGGLGAVEGRRHFFRVAARAMRQILTDHARLLAHQERRDSQHGVTLFGANTGEPAQELDLVVLDDSLRRLAELHPRHAQVVELRFLGGLTIAETAEELGVSTTTVESDWAMAKAWLTLELGSG